MPPKKKKPTTILQPIQIGPCKYKWPGLTVRASTMAGGHAGVFATSNLKPGTMIPIIGRRLSPKTLRQVIANKLHLTHAYVYHDKKVGVDGTDADKKSTGINNFGLSIAMMTNEPSRTKPNCLFKLDYLVVAQPIKAGEELFVWYGDEYEPIRQMEGYSLDSNRYLHLHYPHLDNRSWPKSSVRKENTRRMNDLIASCGAPGSGWNNPVCVGSAEDQLVFAPRRV